MMIRSTLELIGIDTILTLHPLETCDLEELSKGNSPRIQSGLAT